MSHNSGNYNSGYYNSGSHNSGNCDSGNYNSGNHNSGNYNSGYYNSGSHNSGHCNSGDYNSGMFNTNQPKLRMFNKDTEYNSLQDLFNRYGPCPKYPMLIKYIDGKLVVFKYKEAWRKMWRCLGNAKKQWFLNLPNFDAKIFEEITGINVEDELNKGNNNNSLSGKKVEVRVDGVTYTATID